MTRCYTVLFLVVAFVFNRETSVAQAPPIDWQKTLGGSSFDQGEAIQQTSDGGYIVCGSTTSTNGDVTQNHGFGDVWVVKLNAVGTIEWQHAYGGSADDAGFYIEQTSDNGYIVAGTSTSTNGDATANHGLVDCWVLKLDSNGALQWQKNYGGSSVEIPYEIHATADHGYVFAGYTNSSDGDVTLNHGGDDYWVVKLDSVGGIVWQKTFGGTAEDRALSIDVTNDGFVVSGYTMSNDGDVTNNHGDHDYWVVKLNASGALQWQHTYGGTLDDEAKSIRQTLDGGFITSGYTASNNGDVTFNHGFEDLWMVKLHPNGDVQWQKSLGGAMVDQAYSVRQTPNGDYIAAGSSFSLDGQVTGNHGGYDYWIAKTDSTGSLLWQNSFGGSSVEEAYCIQVTDSGYAVVGGTLSSDGDVTNNHGDNDIWVIALMDTTVIEKPTAVQNALREPLHVYPNPSNDLVQLDFAGAKGVLTVCNALGQTLRRVDVGQEKITLRGLPVGVNAFRFVSQDGVATVSGRFIVTR